MKYIDERKKTQFEFSGKKFVYDKAKNNNEYLATLEPEERRNTLIENNIPLVRNICKGYHGKYYYEDIFMTGIVGLIKAVDTFKTDKGIMFATYASTCIQNEIRMYFRRQSKFLINEISFTYVSTGVDKEGEEKEFEGAIFAYEDKNLIRVELKEDAELLNSIIPTLKEKEQKLLMLRFIDDLTQIETSKILNVTQSYVSRLEKKLIKKIKRRIEYGRKTSTN